MLKNCLVILFIICFCLPVFAYETPDPLYLNSTPLDADKIEQKTKVKDPRTLNEKFRAKFHLPPTRKIYLHNIDKSGMPVTEDEYYIFSADTKRSEFVIPEPVFTHADDIILPEPKYKVILYNTPPGQRNFDLSKVIAQRAVTSPGILSPDKSKMVYTKAFFYPEFGQISSAAYYIPIKSRVREPYYALYNTNIIEGDQKPIVEIGMDYLINFQFKSLYPIDWSRDSSKIAFKEKIGSSLEQTWQTNIIIYDFDTKNWKRLSAVREAIIYWWRTNKNIDLKDYLWDIFPVGWDKNNPDRIVLYAYAFTDKAPMFLGTWSIDFKEAKSMLVSIDSTDVGIDLNGYGLKELKLEN